MFTLAIHSMECVVGDGGGDGVWARAMFAPLRGQSFPPKMLALLALFVAINAPNNRSIDHQNNDVFKSKSNRIYLLRLCVCVREFENTQI